MPASNELPDRRGQIIAAAENVFEAKGFAAATMEAVAEQAGVSKGSLYNYFQSKHDLFGQVFSHAVTGAEADTEQIIRLDLSAAEKLQRLLDYWFERMGAFKRMGRLVLEFWVTASREGREGELASSFRAMYSRWRELVGSILSQGVEAGEFRQDFDTPVAASLIMAIMDGILMQAILEVGITIDQPFVGALKRAILVALRGRAEPQEVASR